MQPSLVEMMEKEEPLTASFTDEMQSEPLDPKGVSPLREAPAPKSETFASMLSEDPDKDRELLPGLDCLEKPDKGEEPRQDVADPAKTDRTGLETPAPGGTPPRPLPGPTTGQGRWPFMF